MQRSHLKAYAVLGQTPRHYKPKAREQVGAAHMGRIIGKRGRPSSGMWNPGQTIARAWKSVDMQLGGILEATADSRQYGERLGP